MGLLIVTYLSDKDNKRNKPIPVIENPSPSVKVSKNIETTKDPFSAELPFFLTLP